MLREEDLPAHVREALNTPCTTCGKKGIHDCKYDDKKVISRLEREEKEKKKLKPEKIENKSYSSLQKPTSQAKRPLMGIRCIDCNIKKYTKDGLCIDCTHKRREEAKNRPIVLKDRWGKPLSPEYKIK